MKKESVETFGKCFIPKKIMKQENIQSGNTILIKATVNEISYSFVATAWEKKNLSNALIELFPCCFKCSTLTFPDSQYIIGSLSPVQKKIPTALRLTMDTLFKPIQLPFQDVYHNTYIDVLY